MLHACWQGIRRHATVAIILVGVCVALVPFSFECYVDIAFQNGQPRQIDLAILRMYQSGRGKQIATALQVVGVATVIGALFFEAYQESRRRQAGRPPE
jgi:hypothetical protein